MLSYRAKNKEICQRIQIFVICKKSIQKIWKKLNAGLDDLKTASKKVVNTAAEATGEFIWKQNRWQNCET